jgi:hypothetical protein
MSLVDICKVQAGRLLADLKNGKKAVGRSGVRKEW